MGFFEAPKHVMIDLIIQRSVPTTSIPCSVSLAAQNDWVAKCYSSSNEEAFNPTAGRAQEIKEVSEIEGAQAELAYFKQKSTKAQSETHKAQAELVSTRKELGWIKMKLAGT